MHVNVAIKICLLMHEATMGEPAGRRQTGEDRLALQCSRILLLLERGAQVLRPDDLLSSI